jgi:hypothetical protein
MSLKPQIMRTTNFTEYSEEEEVAKEEHRSGSFGESQLLRERSLVRRWSVV